jgi:hypothetical protein
MAFIGKLGTSSSWFSNIELGYSIVEVPVTSTLTGESSFSALKLLENLSATLSNNSTFSGNRLQSVIRSTIVGNSTLVSDLFNTLSSRISGEALVTSNLGLRSLVTVSFPGEAQLGPSLSSIYEITQSFSGESQVVAELGYSLQLLEAQAINPNTIVLRFSAYPDLSASATRDVSHYVISQLLGDPNPITVVRVVEDPDPKSLRLITSKQVYTLYQVEVDIDIISIYGSPGSPDHNTLTFTGFPEVGRQKNQAVSLNRILVNFNQVMSLTGLTDPLNYVVKDSSGSAVLVSSVTTNVSGTPTKVTLQLSTSLAPSKHFSLTVDPSILSSQGLDILPPTTKVDWFSRQRLVRVPLSSFTGEILPEVEVEVQNTSETLQLEESLVVEHEPYQIRLEYPEGYLEESHEILEELTITSSNSTEISYAIGLVESLSLTESLSPSLRVSMTPLNLSIVEEHTLKELLTITSPTEIRDSALVNSSLVGASNGLVFFSPSLTSGSPNSSLKVDSVVATTQAKDTYRFPQPSSVSPMILWGSASGTTLNNSGCLDVSSRNLSRVTFTLTPV